MPRDNLLDPLSCRCLAHVVNLVVQKILAALDEAEDPDDKDEYVENKDLPIHYDPENDPDLNALQGEVFESDIDQGTEEEDAVGIMKELAIKFAKMTPLQKVCTCIWSELF